MLLKGVSGNLEAVIIPDTFQIISLLKKLSWIKLSILKMNNLLNLENILNSIKGNLGEDDYLEPLEMLISSLNNEANLSYFGALGAKFQISNHLKIRAKLFDYVSSNELNEPSPPIFVMGLPRSGTTHLF